MTRITGAAPQGDSYFARAWNGVTRPFSMIGTTASGFLNETLREVRASPMTWIAILVLAGAVSLMAKSYHIGTVFISAVGVLLMWQDMLDEDAARVAGEAVIPAIA